MTAAGHYYCVGKSEIVVIVDGLAELVAHDDNCGDIEMMLS